VAIVFRVLRHPGVPKLFALNVLSRVPTAAAGVLIVVHAHALTGSYAAAGVVAAASALAVAAASPLLGGIVDRRGQTGVLVWSGLVAGGAYVALGVLPRAAPLGAIVLLAVATGATQPPLGACLRTLWPDVLGGDRDAIRSAFALEAAVLELTYISGPAGFLLLAAVTSTGVSMAVLGVTLAVGTVAFAAHPASRAWRPQDGAGISSGPRGSALRAPGVQTIAAATVLVGVVMGGTEVAVTAAGNAHGRGATSALLALWGLGSLIGGVVAARMGGARGARDLLLLLVALGVAHAALAAGGSSAIALGALLLAAGAWIAPVFATTTTLTGELARPGTTTEAFSWSLTALAAGVALGSALAGAMVDAAGTAPAFAAAGAAGVIAAAVAAARARTLKVDEPLSGAAA
jgi:predicted MFS family arabinose efflux permease